MQLRNKINFINIALTVTCDTQSLFLKGSSFRLIDVLMCRFRSSLVTPSATKLLHFSSANVSRHPRLSFVDSLYINNSRARETMRRKVISQSAFDRARFSVDFNNNNNDDNIILCNISNFRF